MEQVSSLAVSQVESLELSLQFRRPTMLFGWVAEPGVLRSSSAVRGGYGTRSNRGDGDDGDGGVKTARWDWPSDGAGYISIDEVILECE